MRLCAITWILFVGGVDMIVSTCQAFVVLPSNAVTSASTASKKNSKYNKNHMRKRHTATTRSDQDSDSDATTTSSANRMIPSPPKSQQQQPSLIVPVAALSALTLVTLVAKMGMLPGPLLPDGITYGVYSDGLIARDVGTTVLAGGLGYLFVQRITYANQWGWLQSRDARKIIHTCSAPLFMLLWPLYSNAPGARILASIIPLINALRLYVAATSSSNDESALAKAVSRSGNVQEALGGPFIYLMILALVIVVFWTSNPIGIVAMTTLAVGDGVADLVGRRYGRTNPWPGLQKSVAGSLAFWVASTIASTGLLLWMQHWNCLTLSYQGVELIVRVALISLGAAILELIPWADDNYTVPLSAAVLSFLLLT